MTLEEPGFGDGGDEVASLGQRAFGRSIDLLVIATISMAFIVPSVSGDGDLEIDCWTRIVALLIWFGYEGVMVAMLGTTVGKMAVGCRVADRRSGGRPPWPRALLRAVPVPFLLPIVSFIALGLYATAVLDGATHRGVTDRLADTVVVRGPGRPADRLGLR